jgi:hypothetical protein
MYAKNCFNVALEMHEWKEKENMQTDKEVIGKHAEISEILAVF